MTRYVRLYLHFLRFSFSKAMEFRVDFTFRIIMDFILYSVNLLFFKIIFLHTPFIGGWSESQLMIFVCSYLFIDALHMTIFANNMWWFPLLVNRGDLDYYLVRPVSPLFFLTFREFAANSFINLIGASSLFVWSLLQYEQSFQFSQLALFIGMILMGLLLYVLLQLTFLMIVFWTQSKHGLWDLFYAIAHVHERPDRIFTGALRILFTTILPFSIIISFPARIFFEGFQWNIFLHMAIVIVFFSLIVALIWNRGLRNYGSASS